MADAGAVEAARRGSDALTAWRKLVARQELDGASFRYAYLGLANFRLTEFKDIDLTDADMVNTAFVGCDLRGARGWKPSVTVVHRTSIQSR
jgi:uncharacterized protein YjbI with pentapeptide repeats